MNQPKLPPETLDALQRQTFDDCVYEANPLNSFADRAAQDFRRMAGDDEGESMMRVGIAADHGGFTLKTQVAESLRGAGYEIVDFGAHQLNPEDDYPDFIVPLARAIAAGKVERGMALCGSGVGASIAANKVPGVRACLIHDVFSARQGVEDDDMNVFCLGGRVIGASLALELIETFLAARCSGAERHERRRAKVQALENHPELKTAVPKGVAR